MRKVQFANDYLYHIYNRGTEKREVFLEEKDYFRFIHDLYAFNDVKTALNLTRKIERGEASFKASFNRKRELLVEVLVFTQIPNHFHLILRQKKEGGISKFMQKLGTGHTMFFNQKYDRNGVLFQGPFKAILIDKDEYLLSLSCYIHLNPLELKWPGWKEKGVEDWPKALKFLKGYRWSSCPDYLGIKNFPSVINKNFILNYFDGKEKNYEKYLMEWAVRDLEKIEKLLLEEAQ